MALPVRAAPRIRDLVGTMGSDKVGSLLFGRSYVGHHSDDKLLLKDRNGERELLLVGVDEKRSEFFHEDPHLVGVRLALRDPVGDVTEAYIRARFVVDHPGTMWRWQRVLGRRNGALIDFRVPDPREELHHDRSSIEKRAKPLGGLDAFFILPERFRLQASNPDLTYTRTLEGEAWRPYLRRSVDGISKYRPNHQQLMVHRWHPVEANPKKAREVSRDQPFRGFLQFDRAPAFRAPSDVVLLVALMIGCLYLLFEPLTLRSDLDEVTVWAGDRVSELVKLIVALGIVGGLSLLYEFIAKRKNLPRLFRQLKRGFKKAEYAWFKAWS